MNIGHNIKKIRELKDLKQDYVASRIGVSRRYYIMMESDEVDIRADRLDQIARVLDVNVSELISFDDKKMFYAYQSADALNSGAVRHLQLDLLERQVESFEKLKELYEKLLLEKDSHIRSLEEFIRFQKNKLEKRK